MNRILLYDKKAAATAENESTLYIEFICLKQKDLHNIEKNSRFTIILSNTL